MNDQRPRGRPRMCIHRRLYRIEAVIDRSVTVAMNSDRDAALIEARYLPKKCLAGDRRITTISTVPFERDVIGLCQIPGVALNAAIGNDLNPRHTQSRLSKVIESDLTR